MGEVVHTAIVVTGDDHDEMKRFLRKARSFGLRCSAPIASLFNSYWTVLIGPDGSKLGWPQRGDGDIARQKIRDFLESLRFEDGSSPVEWVEVDYGDDLYGQARVTRESGRTHAQARQALREYEDRLEKEEK